MPHGQKVLKADLVLRLALFRGCSKILLKEIEAQACIRGYTVIAQFLSRVPSCELLPVLASPELAWGSTLSRTATEISCCGVKPIKWPSRVVLGLDWSSGCHGLELSIWSFAFLANSGPNRKGGTSQKVASYLASGSRALFRFDTTFSLQSRKSPEVRKLSLLPA